MNPRILLLLLLSMVVPVGKRQPQTVLTAWLVEILPRVVGYHL